MATGGLSTVRERIAAAAARSDRCVDAVTLVAVSKTVGVAEIAEAYAAGHRDFGENRAHDLVQKAAQLPDDITWHFIGNLQSRKAKQVAPVAAMVHSIDRESLLRSWARTGSAARLLLQLNLAHEEQKHGADESDVARLLDLAAELGLDISGLMLMPPLVVDAEDNRPWFQRLRQIRDELQPAYPAITELSMGMTDDFEVAVEEGATLIRVGRAIFGS